MVPGACAERLAGSGEAGCGSRPWLHVAVVEGEPNSFLCQSGF